MRLMVSRDLDVVDMGVGRDLAGQHHEAGVGQRLGGDPRRGSLLEDGVEDGVGDLVGHLVGMAFGPDSDVKRSRWPFAKTPEVGALPGLAVSGFSGERFSSICESPASGSVTRR